MGNGKLYRSLNGKIMGGCVGLSDWLAVDLGLVRLAFVLGALFSGGVVIFLYLGLGIFLPIRESNSEDSVFNKEKDWDERFKNS